MNTTEIHIRINAIKERANAVEHECLEGRDGDVCIRPMLYNDEGIRVVRYRPDPCEFKPLFRAVAELEAIEKTFATLPAGWATLVEHQEIYVPAAVWTGDKEASGGGGPTVSVAEALALGAIPGTLNLAEKTAQWPQSFWG